MRDRGRAGQGTGLTAAEAGDSSPANADQHSALKWGSGAFVTDTGPSGPFNILV